MSPSPIHVAALRILVLVCLVLLPGYAAEPPSEPNALAESLPNLFLKLSARQPVHVAFVGDSVFMDHGEQPSAASSFLKELSTTFYYTGGVHDVYDERQLNITSPKITYEQLRIDQPNCFNLVQHVTTLGLLNAPDLLVVFAGTADANQEVTLPVYIAAFASIVATARAAEAEVVMVAPRLLDWEKAEWPVNLRTRPYANLLSWWCKQQGLPFVDPNESLLPRSVLFEPNADPKSIWSSFVEQVHASAIAYGSVKLPWRALTLVGKQLYGELAGHRATDRRLKVDVTATSKEELTLRLTNTTSQALGGMTVTSIVTGPGVVGQAFALGASEANAIEVPLSSKVATYRGLIPVSCLNIDERRVQLSDIMVPAADVGVEWLDRSAHNTPHEKSVPIRCRVFPYKKDLGRLKYEIRAGNESTTGTLTFAGSKPAEIDWAMPLSQSPDDLVVQLDIELILGEGAQAVTHVRRMEAVRQFALNTKADLRALTAGAEAPDSDAQLTNLVEPGLTLTAEASKDEISFHFDFKNIALPSTIRKPALELGLALDARPFDKRQTVGHVGVLQVSSTADDGPATISPFAPLAHFGNGYARRPLPSGVQARLSTRPNGDRRLTVQMVRKYFYLHPWLLGNGNSQLGIRATVAVAQKNSRTPAVFALHAAYAHPNNAEALAILELTENGTKRWCAKFWDPRD